jgi:transposase InsO family protein
MSEPSQVGIGEAGDQSQQRREWPVPLACCSQRILRWHTATSMRTALVLEALGQAMWARRRDGRAHVRL